MYGDFDDGGITRSGKGLSWRNPYTTLSEALAVAAGEFSVGTYRIYIKAVTYTLTDDSGIAFTNTVKIYGGFAGEVGERTFEIELVA